MADGLTHIAISFFILAFVAQLGFEKLPSKIELIRDGDNVKIERNSFWGLKIFACSIFGILSDTLDKPLFGARLWFHSVIILSIFWVICYMLVTRFFESLKPWILLVVIASFSHIPLDMEYAVPLFYPLLDDAYWIEFDLKIKQGLIPSIEAFKFKVHSIPVEEIPKFATASAVTFAGLILFLFVFTFVFIDTVLTKRFMRKMKATKTPNN